MNEPIDFVKNAMVCNHDIIYPVQYFLTKIALYYQQDGTAVLSLAREQLLEVETLKGPAIHVQEEIVKRALGSMYQGESLCIT